MSTSIYRGPAYRIPTGLAKFGIGKWEERLGNHRAVVSVAQAADAVCAYVPWRRRDAHPETKDIVVVEADSPIAVTNRVVVSCNREYGEVVFQPRAAGTYYLYYMIPVDDENAYKWPRWAFPITRYVTPRETADAAWLARHHLGREDLRTIPLITAPNESSPYPASWRTLPEAELVEIQARGEWHSFYPMEIVATLDERLELERRCRYRPFVLFPEDRTNPIRMTEALPYHWAVRDDAALDRFAGEALPNEYYVFQIGVYASKGPLLNLGAQPTDLVSTKGGRIKAERITCFNLGGNDQYGHPFAKTLHVPKGTVQALWFGVDVAESARVGVYRGSVTVSANGTEEQRAEIELTVGSGVLRDRGDGDHWRLARLRWLDSREAADEELCAPFTAVAAKGRTVRILGRTLELGKNGLPTQLTSHIDMFDIVESGRRVLAAPVGLEVSARGSKRRFTWTEARRTHLAPGMVVYNSSARAGSLELRLQAKVEMDGYLGYRVTLEGKRDLELDTVRLRVPILPDVARYELYPGQTVARACPGSFEDPLHRFELIWIGDYNAGIAVRLQDSKISWENEGRGMIRHRRSEAAHTIELQTGALTLAAGTPRSFDFELYVTPFKPLPRAHWQWRYYHAAYGNNLDIDKGLAAGAKVFTLHHAATTHPYISYPFLVAGGLRAISDRIHAKGGLFKAYYTIRELSTRAPEIWALRSLGEEVLEHALGNLGFEELSELPLEYQLRDPWGHPNTGQSWMCEHFVSDYHTRWHSVFTDPALEQDSSLQVSGASRWGNFYLEGLRWLMENAGMDGLYLDGITHDREAFKRVRKTLVRRKPQGLIDYHSGVTAIPQLPYFDSIWFGEGADYSREPAYWLVAVSGIPFGVPGELLLPDASVERAMVYGLCQRYGWMSTDKVDPSALWKWWDTFGIEAAEMLGYWRERCPVRVSSELVKATAYVRRGERTAIAVASWAKEPLTVALEVDWDALGLEAGSTRVAAPEIGFFQPALARVSLSALPVEPGKGWIVVLSREGRQ